MTMSHVTATSVGPQISTERMSTEQMSSQPMSSELGGGATRRPLVGLNTSMWAAPLSDVSLPRIAGIAAAAGFDVLELQIEDPEDLDPVLARSVLDDLGLQARVAVTMPEGRELVDSDRWTIAETQSYLRRCVDAAHSLGSAVVSGPVYASVGRRMQLRPLERLEMYDELRTNLAPVVDHAVSAEVRIGVEPLNRYETSLINTIGQALEAIDGLPREGCGVALDVFHQNIEETNIADAVAAAAGRIVALQVSSNHRGVPSRGHLDLGQIVGAAVAAGYTGPLCIEASPVEWQHFDEMPAPADETCARVAHNGLEYLRTLTVD